MGAGIQAGRDKRLGWRGPWRETIRQPLNREDIVRRRQRAPSEMTERAGTPGVVEIVRGRLPRIALIKRPRRRQMAYCNRGVRAASGSRLRRLARRYELRNEREDSEDSGESTIAHQPMANLGAVNRNGPACAYGPSIADSPSLCALSNYKKSTKRHLCHSCAPCVGNFVRHSPSPPFARYCFHFLYRAPCVPRMHSPVQ
jgi:hypothetical protein